MYQQAVVGIFWATLDFDKACVIVCARMRTFLGTACVKMATVGDCGSWRKADSLG